MAYSPGKRLQFERDVFAQNAQPMLRQDARRSSGRLLRVLAIATVIAGVGTLGAAVVLRGGFFGSEKREIERMATTFVKGLASPDAVQALEACAESTRGAKLVHEEEGETFGNAANETADAEGQLATLRTIRADLESHGVNWGDVAPLAFGGVRARVEGDDMKRPLTVLTGDLYFKSGASVFAVEISAWRCEGEYVIVDVWKGYEVEGGEAGLKQEATKRYDQFQQEQPDSQPLDVSYAKQLYVAF